VAILPRTRSGPDAYIADAYFGDAEEKAAPHSRCDRQTLEAEYPQLAPRVCRFLADLFGDASLAKDAAQETFVRAFRKVDDLPPETRLVPWVFGVARNVSFEIRKARGRVRRVVLESDDSNEAVPDRAARSPEAVLLDREALLVVERALAQLSDDRRAALLLRLDQGLSYDEIAAAMGWSLAKVKVEIFRAREVLRATLDVYRSGGKP
jgi:RNA polymerase sigma-70 factor (ECF subfamily)